MYQAIEMLCHLSAHERMMDVPKTQDKISVAAGDARNLYRFVIDALGEYRSPTRREPRLVRATQQQADTQKNDRGEHGTRASGGRETRPQGEP